MALSKELVKHMTEPELKQLVNQFGKKDSKEKKLLCLTIDNPDAEKADNMNLEFGELVYTEYFCIPTPNASSLWQMEEAIA